MLEAERSEVAAACRRLAAEGLLIGTAGNLSARAEGRVAITPTGAVLAELEGRNAALMANHGALNYAPDVGTAVENALLLEWACTVYWRAAAIGAPRVLDEAERQAVVATAVERGYGTTQPASPEERGEEGR